LNMRGMVGSGQAERQGTLASWNFGGDPDLLRDSTERPEERDSLGV
jgi:hypothetical protein